MKYRSRRQMNATHRNRPRKLQKKWTIEEDKVMVQMIEERPAIWNFCSPEYRNLDTKKKCWMDVAVSTNHSVVDAKNRWNTVKSRFNLERKKALQYYESGQSEATFISNYELYQPLQFLATVEGRPPRKTTRHGVINKDDTHGFEDSRATLSASDRAIIRTSTATKRKRKRFTSPVPIQNSKLTHLLSEISDIIKSRQEVTPAKRWKKAFLEFISCELDRYEDHNAQILKNQILTACMNFQPELYVESHKVEYINAFLE